MKKEKLSVDLHRCKDKDIKKSVKLKIVVPIAPSVNHMYMNVKGGGKRLTKKAEDYMRTARAIINECAEEQRWDKLKKGIWSYADVVIFMPDKRIRDSHNMIKIIMDVMESVVFENDYYALPRIQSVEYDKENPRVEIRITHQTKAQRMAWLKELCA